MKTIERTCYLNKLFAVKGSPDIKVITGIRRSGKSMLLEAFIDKVKKQEPATNIVHINFNDVSFEFYKEYHALNYFVEKQYVSNVNNILCIDEVQSCQGFEIVINSLHSQNKWDIYITGSNAFLLSSDLATLFTGRVFPIEVYPFSFAEFCTYYKISDKKEAFRRYVKEGGFAGSYVYSNEEDKSTYLKTVFETLIIRDIVDKYNIKSQELLERITDYLIDNSSCETSSRNIANYISSNFSKTNHATVSDYLKYLTSAFAFYKVRRYDVLGKTYLMGQEKYYLADHSLRYALLGNKNQNIGRTLENIVGIELLRRGYEVYTCQEQGREIDFVALRQHEKIYIQVCADVSDEKTFEREYKPLLKIKDAYPKMIITNTTFGNYDYEGIKIIDFSDWLY